MTEESLATPGGPVPLALVPDLEKLVSQYRERKPNPKIAEERVSFGTSGHRGTSLNGSFTETHVLAVTQAIAEYRKSVGYTGPVIVGIDTHALSEPALHAVLEVLVGNGLGVVVQSNFSYVPTPVISHAILAYNRKHPATLADGIILTPSHNPPIDAGIKYNPPNGGPADTDVTGPVQARANELIEAGLQGVLRASKAEVSKKIQFADLCRAYIEELPAVLNLEAIAKSRVRIGVDPLGGATVSLWGRIAERFGLSLEVVNPFVDKTFKFMSLDHDKKIRMDCSSAYAMRGLLGHVQRFDLAIGNDPDGDRHGIVSPRAGLLNPNHYLAVAIEYLLQHRPNWRLDAKVGKTVVSSRIIDAVVRGRGRALYEVPVGFKWFAQGLFEGSLCFGGEESAGASFQRMDGSAWSTDKDGILLGLLAAEIVAVTGKDPAQCYEEICARHGSSYYLRVDTPCSAEQRVAFGRLAKDGFQQKEFAGEAVERLLLKAPGNGAGIGGVKVETKSAWFAARPSGTENLYKLYAESFISAEHLSRVVEEARLILQSKLSGS